MAAGLEPPRNVFAHGWLLVGGEKMSKSKLTGIAPSDITDVFGSDAFRYYFLRAITFGSDGSFSWEDLSARYEAELANGLGNLASRVIAMIHRYRGGWFLIPQQGLLRQKRRSSRSSPMLLRRPTPRCTRLPRMRPSVRFGALSKTPMATSPNRNRGRSPKTKPKLIGSTPFSISQRTRSGFSPWCSTPLCRSMSALWGALGQTGQPGDRPLLDVAVAGGLEPGTAVLELPPLFPRIEQD